MPNCQLHLASNPFDAVKLAPQAADEPARTERTLRSRKGKVVRTTLSDQEAVALLSQIDDDFARDLHRRGQRFGFSSDQLVWVHALAMSHLNPPKRLAVADEAQMRQVAELFAIAGAHLRSPSVQLILDDGRLLQLKRAGERARFPGTVNVSVEGVWAGRIQLDGRFEPAAGASTDEVLIAMLLRFARDPAGVAAQYGRLTGACCFCRMPLSDPRSLEVGYGPRCAQNYGLPWGNQRLPVAELA